MEVNIYIENMQRDKIGRSTGMYLMEAMNNGIPVVINGEPYIRYEQVQVEHCNKTKLSMELLIMALKRLTKSSRISVFTDVESIYYTFKNGWIDNWKNNHWLNAKGLPPKYLEEWKAIVELTQMHEIEVKMDNHSYRRWMREQMMKREN